MLEKLPSIVGEALKGVRPGLEKTLASAAFGDVPATIAVESAAFAHERPMPAAFTADGAGRSPPLAWTNVPRGTAEVVLVVEDADSPSIDPLVHAIAFGLPAEGALPEGALGGGEAAPGVAVGQNSFLKAGYLPPDPPSGHGAHRYVVQVFALGKASGLTGEPGRGAVVDALKGKVSAMGVLIGTYERP